MDVSSSEDAWRPNFTYLGPTDEKLTVGKRNPRVFEVHKCILIAESKMFGELFSEESTFKRDDLINEDPTIFEMMMKRIYGECITITDLKTLWDFFKLGKKYDLSENLDFAIKALKSIPITEFDFWELIESDLFKHPLFTDKLHNFIAENAEDIITSEKIFALPEVVLNDILLMDALNIGEYDLLVAVTEWGLRNIEQVSSEKLQKFYKHIRFGTLRSDQMISFYDCYSKAIDYESIKNIFWYLHSTARSRLPEWCSKNHVVRKLEFKRLKRMVDNKISEPELVIDLLD